MAHKEPWNDWRYAPLSKEGFKAMLKARPHLVLAFTDRPFDPADPVRLPKSCAKLQKSDDSSKKV